MPNGDFHDLTEREILVKVATKLSYMERSIEDMSKNTKEHIETLRITLNDCNQDHCKRESDFDNRLKDVEKRIWNVSAVFGFIIFGATFLKDELLNFILRR